MNEAFVYCWTDHVTLLVYVGYHKGSVHDGYVCSSHSMLLEFKARPADFTREILYTGTLAESFRFEQKIIKQLMKTPTTTYNKRFGAGGIPWNAGKTGIYSEEHINKLRLAGIGRKDSAATTKKRSENNINNGNRGNWNRAIKEGHYERVRAALTGRKQRTLVCPHCSIVASAGNAVRWHFDNCKNKHE